MRGTRIGPRRPWNAPANRQVSGMLPARCIPHRRSRRYFVTCRRFPPWHHNHPPAKAMKPICLFLFRGDAARRRRATVESGRRTTTSTAGSFSKRQPAALAPTGPVVLRGTESLLTHRWRAGGERIRTFGSVMRWHRRQRRGSVTPPDPGGERWLLGPPLDNSVGVRKLATARMTGAPVDRPRLGRTHENRCLSSAEPEVRIHLPPGESRLRTRFLQRRARGLNDA